MHEMGIVSSILRVAIDTARHERALRVNSVSVRIGDMREVVPDALDFAWDVLREDDALTTQAELKTECVHPRSRCESCGAEFDHDQFHRRCPVCDSADTTLMQGKELDITAIEIETDDDLDAVGVQ